MLSQYIEDIFREYSQAFKSWNLALTKQFVLFESQITNLIRVLLFALLGLSLKVDSLHPIRRNKQVGNKNNNLYTGIPPLLGGKYSINFNH